MCQKGTLIVLSKVDPDEEVASDCWSLGHLTVLSYKGNREGMSFSTNIVGGKLRLTKYKNYPKVERGFRAPQVVLVVKNLLAYAGDTREVGSALGHEDPLE